MMVPAPQLDVDAYLAQLVKVLAAHGIAMTPRVVFDACGDLSPSGVIRGLRRSGLDARLTRFRPEDVVYLPEHSLVWLDDPIPSVIVGTGPHGLRLEHPNGEVGHIGRGALRKRIKGRAITVRVRGAEKGNFLDRVVAALRKDGRFGRAVGLLVVMGVIVTAFGIASSSLSRLALNEAIPQRAPGKLTAVAVGTLLLFAHQAWAGWIRRRTVMFLETKLSELGVEELVRHLLGLPFARLAKLELGQVIELTRIGERAVGQLLTIATSIFDGVIAIGYLAFVFWLDTLSGLAATVGALLLLGLGVLVGRRSYELRSATMEAGRKQQQALVEIVSGIETVKAEAAEERMLVRYLGRLVALQGLAIREQEEQSLHGALSLVIDRLVYGVILMLVATRALADQANVGDLMAAIQASASFFASAQSVSKLTTMVYGLRAQVARVDELLVEPTESLEAPTVTAAAPEGAIAITLRNVWFRYDPAAPWVLRGMDVEVPRGATVVLEWPSGAGKSTLLRLLSGLLGPERGDVLVFGTEATRARHLVTYLPQHAALLPMSIMDNLKLLSGGSSLERIAAAAEATGLAAIVKAWPMGFDTIVSAGSSNVSSGQRQLVLFTAAVASQAPILLLDEAFAHMDGVMRARLAGLDLLRGRTVVAVVHDASLKERKGASATLVLGHGEGARLLRQ